MRRVRRSSAPVRVELTAMIDVVFLLLTFFLFSMVLMVRADVLDVVLPEIGSGRTGETAPSIVVVVDAGGDVFVEGERTELPAVAARITELREDREGAPVLLAADELGSAGRLIELADALAGAGVSEFTIVGRRAATPPSAPAERTPTDAAAQPSPEPAP